MKEATGELNMTVITVVAIAAVAAFFYAFVWPSIKNSIAGSTACSQGAGTTVGTSGTDGYVSCGTVDATGSYTCTYHSNGKDNTVTCSQK